MRCISWRPLDASDSHIGHRPGTCRTCWTICRARVEPGQYRCHECALALARHPSATIRLYLANEDGGAPPDVLELLAFDADAGVAAAARRALRRASAHTDITWEG